MFWILPAAAMAIHERQLAEHGGRNGIRDPSLLESALSRPRQLYSYSRHEPDLAQLAASLAAGLVQNMPFIDGNKRTAHVCYRAFLGRNSRTLVAPDADKVVHMIGLAAGTVPESEFAAWLRSHIR